MGLMYLAAMLTGPADASSIICNAWLGVNAGPALMPGGTEEAYKHIEDIVRKVAAQVDDGPCVTYVGNGGAGNFVKMVHNGIEYGDMQLISEAYDILKTVGGFSNEELGDAFDDWNRVTSWQLFCCLYAANQFSCASSSLGLGEKVIVTACLHVLLLCLITFASEYYLHITIGIRSQQCSTKGTD